MQFFKSMKGTRIFGYLLGFLVVVGTLFILFESCVHTLDTFYDDLTTSTTTSSSTTIIPSSSSDTTTSISITSITTSTTTTSVDFQISLDPFVDVVDSDSATIVWETNRLATSWVEYSTESGFSSASALRYPFVPSSVYASVHTLTLDGLGAGVTYYFVTYAESASGIVVSSSEGSFETPAIPLGDSLPPDFVEGPVLTMKDDTSATWEWTSSEKATEQFEYATTPGFELGTGTSFTADPDTTEYFHTMEVTGFQPNTTYYYHILTADASGNVGDSGELQFTTNPIDDRYGWMGAGGSCAHSGAGACWNTDGAASTANTGIGFNEPVGINTDSSGNIYITDMEADRMIKHQATTLWEGWVGRYDNGCCSCASWNGVYNTAWTQNSGNYPYCEHNAFGAFAAPVNLHVDTNMGYIYVPNSTGHHVARWTHDGLAVATTSWLGGGVANWHNTGASAGFGDYTFNSPYGVSSDPDPSNPDHPIYVADLNNHRVVKYLADGTYQGCVGGGQSDFSTGCQNIAGPDDEYFYKPISVDVALDGSVYVVDYGNHCIRKYDTDGNYYGWIGSGHIDGWSAVGAAGSGYQDGAFYYPYDITVDISTGDLYIADSRNHRVQKWTAAGVYQGWIGKGHTSFIQGVNGAPESGNQLGEFNTPKGVAFDYVNNRLYIADTLNHRIQRFDF
jgi:hypothetical protein